MMTQIMMPRYAPAPSSPAQGRAAGRLRGSDGATRPSQVGRRSINPALSTLEREKQLHSFGRVVTPGLPERGPDAGTTDQVRPRSTLLAPTTHL
jgi:hypothetical protein